MGNILKIALSKEASIELKKLLEEHNKDYFCIKLSYYKGCCKSSNIDIYLDDFNNKKNYVVQNINDIPFIYNDEVINNIKAIELKYESSGFMIKSVPIKVSQKDCSTCSSGCGSKGNCGSCGGCKH